MLRNDWKFEHTAPQLAEAAKARIDYHDKQLAFWNTKRTEVMATIRAEGIEVNEKIALALGNPKARDYERGGEIMIRNDLRKALVETYDKLKYHTQRRDTYDGWQQVLSVYLGTPESRFALDIDDWLFFCGRDTETDDWLATL